MLIQESIQELMSVLKCQRRLQPTTLKTYQCELNQLAAWLKATYGIHSTEGLAFLSGRKIEAFWNDASVSVKKLRLSVARRWLTFLQDHKIIFKTGINIFTPIHDKEAGRDNLSDAVGEITPKENLDALQACLFALLSSGLRIAEIQTINLSDFTSDFQRLIVNGKGRKQRLVMIDSDTANRIQTYIHMFRVKDRLFSQTIPVLRKQIRQLSVERAAPHDFRRRFATSAYRSEGRAESIQDALGHGSVGTTEIYISKDAKIQGMMRDYKLAHPRA